MFGLALLGFGIEGCQSGCGGCGVSQSVTGFTQKVSQGFSDFGNKVFHHKRASSGECCEGGAVVGDSGVPMTVVPGPIMQGPVDGETPELKPINPGSGTSKSSVPGTGQRPPAGANKMSFETDRPVNDGSRSRGERTNVARALIPPIELPRGADRSATNPLDHLPPVDLPGEVTRKGATAPVPLEAEALTPPASAKTEAKDAKPAASNSAARRVDLNASAVEPPSALVTLPAVGTAVETGVSPGIKRFTGVGPSLAAGSLPTPEGLDWLKEKGYKTFLDLRERKDVDPGFVDDVINRGLRYVALPISLNRLDENRVARFREELAVTDSRPLYFADLDGVRPALLWYVHRSADDRVESSMAKREAEEIAPLPEALWGVASKYLTGRVSAKLESKGTGLRGGLADASLNRPIDVRRPMPSPLLETSAVLHFTGFGMPGGEIPRQSTTPKPVKSVGPLLGLPISASPATEARSTRPAPSSSGG